MSILRPKLPVILPLLLGIGLLWALDQWKPLAKTEHQLFIFPERFETETIFPDRGHLPDFKVTPLKFTGEVAECSLNSYLIDDATREIIDLSPEKWAYFLKTIEQNSEGLLVITAPLSWADASELSLETLGHQISKMPDIVIGLDAEFNDTSAELPPFLEDSVISPKTPDLLQIPTIDFLTLPPSIKAPLFGISTVQGFIIETTSTTLKVPMLVRWADSILPSTHLAALIAAHQISPQEVIIDPSGYLRLGLEGSILKIDSQGRASLPNIGNASISASQILIYPEKTSSSKIILPDHAPKFLSLLETHLTRSLAQKPTPLKTYKRWSFPIEIATLILFTLLLQARRLWLTLLGIAAIFLTSVYLNHWFSCTPLALILVTFTILPKPSPKKAAPLEEKEKAKEQPEKPKEEKKETPPKKNPQKKAAKKTAFKATKKTPRKQAQRKKKKRR